MLALLGNILIAQQFNDLEELLQVEVLLASDYIYHVVKLVLLILLMCIVSKQMTNSERAQK
jgi:hypothetical protein